MPQSEPLLMLTKSYPAHSNSMYRKANLQVGAYKLKDDGDIDGLGDGTAGGSWEKSAGSINITLGANFVGSPDSVHVSVLAV